MVQQLSLIKKLNKESKYFEDLYDIFWKISEGEKLTKQHYNNVSIGLFNIPCAGFGDIIVCKTFYDYLKEWYPTSKIKICTTTPEKLNPSGDGSNANVNMGGLEREVRAMREEMKAMRTDNKSYFGIGGSVAGNIGAEVKSGILDSV